MNRKADFLQNESIRIENWNALVDTLCNRKQGIAPAAARRYAPADGSSFQNSRRIYVRPQTGPQSAWWPAVAKLQEASVPIA